MRSSQKYNHGTPWEYFPFEDGEAKGGRLGVTACFYKPVTGLGFGDVHAVTLNDVAVPFARVSATSIW